MGCVLMSVSTSLSTRYCAILRCGLPLGIQENCSRHVSAHHAMPGKAKMLY